ERQIAPQEGALRLCQWTPDRGRIGPSFGRQDYRQRQREPARGADCRGQMTPADQQNLVRLERVDKQYGEGEVAVLALQEIDLELPHGEFVVFVGPSGSGKTTLLN